MRLISSGMARSKLRSPASTWPVATPILTATSVQAAVEFTSPTTSTSCGLRSVTTFSNSIMMRPVCSPWLPDPTPMYTSGRGSCRSSKKTFDMFSS